MKKILPISLLFLASAASASPAIVAHRGGTADAPENTLPAIKLALENKADIVWITVQLSRDGVPVLYRPADLKALTNLQGKVSQYTAEELAKADASVKWKDKDLPENLLNSPIPTLKSVLSAWPDTRFFIDIKSQDADPATMGNALLNVLKETNSLNRVRVYSTEDRYMEALPVEIPRFVTRSETRTRLATISLSHECLPPSQKMDDYWYGLELNRKVEVVEKFTLGEGVSPATLTWDKEAVDCFRSQGNAHLIFIGVNSEEDYQKAKTLGAEGVLVDSPAKAKSCAK
ncbi:MULTISPECIES: glycerophosphodiester phosphodiesterase family protein [Enterobacter]|jgi:glycerophosphoryl diester phosphodiesterase|uniref:Glycerophosphodiester phosphodiesterase n=1 Tax=Enterobacter bugandensis TaxID=881260 RepID=A0ABX4VKT4_9ENTR|nr:MULTISPECIES: glycerophosphodiester phosphodiesterase family protein [Enterobacter]MBZ6367355.1 glycerophosphodiester phosphodiesterase [Enterobacter bugandensis]NUX26910.1 glycerophosphodiester phosphodiesterase [Enterobacter bugandensis]NUX48964.1 glycerophosphodiester phosphodiesterase [Enterobacter bugandensis]NUX70880.1 glycerophosphodiester phosphodiesterase [Enterobacter bugandensis]NUX96258.1 glycerophosphodiester phosphodiesterase [Enterobacter bugandensis]